MSQTAPVISLHPYFKAHPGKLAIVKALLPRFVAQTASEPENVYYEFTMNGDEVFCREAYTSAAGALTHLANVGALLGEMLAVSDLVRVEIHGPAAELDQMRGPLAQFKPAWFVWECGVAR